MTNLLRDDIIHARPVMIVALASDGARHWSPPATVNARPLTLDMDANPHRGLWALQLDDAVRAAPEPTLLVAEGLACLAIARWAQLSPRRYVENIAGACLFAPLAFASHQAPLLRNLQPSPSVRLPFPSTVIDTRASLAIARVIELADIWAATSPMPTPCRRRGTAATAPRPRWSRRRRWRESDSGRRRRV